MMKLAPRGSLAAFALLFGIFALIGGRTADADAIFSTTDLGKVPVLGGVPEIPLPTPGLDAAGNQVVNHSGYYSGPTIGSPDPGFSYTSTEAVTTHSTGIYSTGYVGNGASAGGTAFLSDGTSTHTFTSSSIAGTLSIFPQGVNDVGTVVGGYNVDGGLRTAFVYSDAQGFHTLGTLGGDTSNATAINHSGEVVGSSAVPGGLSRAFVELSGGVMTDLNSLVTLPNWTLATAYDVNDSGKILALGIDASGDRELFLLSQGSPTTTTIVPEPRSLLLWALAAVALLARRYRHSVTA